jgi:hypothetical protein
VAIFGAVASVASFAQTAPAPQPTSNDIALIGGRPVNKDAFNAIIYQVAGMRVFQQVFDLTVVQQACVVSGIPMDGKDYTDRVQAEIDRTLKSFTVTPGTAPTTMSADEKKTWERNQQEMALRQVLSQRGITAVEWRMGMETAAGLRALAKGKIAETKSEEAKTAYEAQYGERRTVFIMVLPANEREASEMSVKYKDLIGAGKKSPNEAAAELKQGQPANWTISANASEVPEIRDATFKLKLKEISPITTVKQKDQPDQKVIIMLDSIQEDSRSKNPYVEADMKQRVFDAKEQDWMNRQLQILRTNAAPTVDIKDPVLKDQFDQVAKALQAQAAAAAAAQSQPAGVTPATGTAPAGLAPAAAPTGTLPALPK